MIGSRYEWLTPDRLADRPHRASHEREQLLHVIDRV